MNKFIFDVDGTLTPSRGVINKKFKSWFDKFASKNDVYLVTGSDKSKTVEQISEDTYNLCKRVYNCNGNDTWEGDTNIEYNTWILEDDEHQWLAKQLNDSKFPLRTGNHFEHRPGMLNFSIVGRNADPSERHKYVMWDTATKEREEIAYKFNQEFPHLEAKVGGETGLDIAPKGADKSQILKDFSDEDTIIFFGDKMEEGGNDLPLGEALVNNQKGKALQVIDWKDTWKKLKEML